MKHITEGKIDGSTEVTGIQGQRRKQLLEIERGSSRSYSVKNSL
jgi:hypothetical protein